MQLQDADVLKLKCKFVTEFVKHLKRSKYSVAANYVSTLKYFSAAYLADQLQNCLSNDDICDLTNKANKYNDNTVTEPEVFTCGEQVIINIATKSTSCGVNFSAKNTGNGSAFPYISSLINNSVSQEAAINIMMQDCEQSESIRIGQWCNGDPLVCNGSPIKAYTGFSIGNVYGSSANSYIQVIKLSWINNNIINNEFLYFNPNNISPYTGCPGCETITGADLYFPTSPLGNAAYKSAWEKLMRNIARIYTGGTNTEALVLTPDTGNFIYRWTIKHNPSSNGYWMGFDRNFPYISLVGFSNNIPSDVFQVSRNVGYLDQNLNFNTTCGEVNVNAVSMGGTAAPVSNLSNFNNIVLSSNYLATPIQITPVTGNLSCTKKVATATVSALGPIASVRWENSIGGTLSNTYTLNITSTMPETYTFFVTLENGCVVSKNVTF